MAISTGGDVAIVIATILGLVVSVAGFFIYRRWKQKRRAQITSRELELDFDTNDLEVGVSKLMGRSMSGSSDRPLIPNRHERHRSSLDSLEADMYTMEPRSTSPAPLPNPYDPPSRFIELHTQPTIPVIKEPSPPPTKEAPPPSLTTKELQLSGQLTTLASRPSFLAKPRPAPHPAQRGRTPKELRAQLLARLASTRSTRSTRRSRSLDGPDSPESMYSQASLYSPASMYSQATEVPDASLDLAIPQGKVIPPVPPLAQEYRHQNFGIGGWRRDLFADSVAPPSSRANSHPPLEDSLAFPLPIIDSAPSPESHATSMQWFQTLWSTSVAASPSHSPNEPLENPHSSASEVPSVRSLAVQHSMPRYVSAAESVEQHGTVGYQLPPNWRAGQTAAVVAMPVPQAFDARISSPRGPR